MRFVYILKSVEHPEKHYIGITDDMERRLKEHNGGGTIYTNKFRPWELETFIAFSNPKLAENFER